jgi:uncharacterized protein YfaS (alpha-2-macroglobulin family)
MYNRSLEYVRNFESRIPSHYGLDAKRALMAYALYVRAQMGERDTGKARKLLSEMRMEDLSLETIGWFLSVLSHDDDSRNEVERLRHNLQNRVTETAGAAHFVSSYKDNDHLLLNSDHRADAIVLEALIADQPENDLIPKIVRGLLAHRTQGRWSSTQENVLFSSRWTVISTPMKKLRPTSSLASGWAMRTQVNRNSREEHLIGNA